MIRSLALACAGFCMCCLHCRPRPETSFRSRSCGSCFRAVSRPWCSGYTVQISAQGNGVLVGHINGYKDQGRWSLSGGKLCITMSSFTGGKPTCSMVVADGGWYRGQESDSASSRLRKTAFSGQNQALFVASAGPPTHTREPSESLPPGCRPAGPDRDFFTGFPWPITTTTRAVRRPPIHPKFRRSPSKRKCGSRISTMR